MASVITVSYTHLDVYKRQPVMRVTCRCGKVKIESHVSRFPSREIQTAHPMDVLREILAQYKSPRLKGQPPFTGGFVGYFAYAMLSLIHIFIHAFAVLQQGYV